MAKKEARSPEQKIKQLEQELADKERELLSFRQELNEVNHQLEKFISQLSSEIKLATLIQRSLVPTDIPNIPGFEFSTKFVASPISGGDYFDVFELEDKMRFGILMANSSGHGMASLFLSVLIRMTTQLEARKGMDASEVLKHIAKEIKDPVKDKDFAHVFYATIDRRKYEMSYVKAGGINTYLYKFGDEKLVRLDETSGPLGKNSKVSSKTETIELEARDKFIVVSNGVTKALNKQDENFGEERLYNCINKNSTAGCHEIRNEILFQVSRFVGSREYIQDLSVVVMSVKDKVIKLKKG